MKHLKVWAPALVVFFTPLALRAQTATWVGGSGGNVFNNTANWSPASVPNGGAADLVFNTSGNNQVGFNSLPVTINSLTVGSGATSGFTFNGNSGTLTIGAGGVTSTAGANGVTFNNGVNIALGASQTWTTNTNVSVFGNVSGSGLLTKAGTGSLTLNGNSSYTGGTTVNAGSLYLSNTNSSSGTITVGASGTLGTAFGDTTLSNAISLASGATLGGSPNGSGGSLELNGAATIASGTTTLNIAGDSDVFFGGTLGAASSTALTVHSAGASGSATGTSIAILGGASSNITSMTADNGAIAFANASALPATVAATNGGYVSVVTIGGGPTPPTVSALMTAIADKAGFNGTIGFDTDDESDQPATYSTNIDLTGFTAGNVRLGSQTSAILTGTITPVAQSYDFGGYAAQDGILMVKSNLTDHGGTTSVTVSSPSSSGGAPQNGQLLGLGGTNTFTGNVSVSYASVLLDSAGALPGGSNISLGAYSYAGYTESAGFANFAAFASRVTAGASTSILGIDSHDVIANYIDNAGIATPATHTINDATLNLSGFSSVTLGTLTGAIINSTSITAPTDNVLRFANIGGDSAFTVNTVLTQSGGLVAGQAGADGVVTLNGNNTYAGGTTLQGGGLLAGHNNAFSSGAITATQTSGDDDLVLGAATNGITLANSIAVTGNLDVGVSIRDDSGNYTAGTNALTLNGVISGTGRLYFTAPTTVSGANTYSGGTYILANTTVTNNTGLGTSFVDLGYTSSTGSTRAVLTFSGGATAPSIGNLADAKQFLGNSYGTGDINMAGTVSSLTVNQTSNLSYSGNFTGAAFALIKNGAAQLTLLGNNAGQFTNTTINAGSIAIGDGNTAGATFGGNVAIAVTGANTGLFLRPSSGQTMAYSGNITGAGAVTLNGNAAGIVNVTGGSSSFTGITSVNAGTLQISSSGAWSSASATNINSGSTFALKLTNSASQTLLNLNGSGKIDIGSGSTLTVNNTSGTTLSGVISGAGALTKTGAGQALTLNGNNTYTGGTTVSSGTLIVNGTMAGTSMTVDSGAFLRGTANVHNLSLSGNYSPGASNSAALVSLDSLTATSTGILLMELGNNSRGTGYDALNITGALAASGTLQVNFINSFNPVAAATFNLFDFGSQTGTFTSVNLPTLTSGLSWNTSALYTLGEISITGTPIPEPATSAVLAGLAIFGLVAIRRRF